MKLITEDQRRKLIANGLTNRKLQERGFDETDYQPVVKLFCPWGGATWLLSEVDPDDEDIAFGLCDLGMGFPELGSVRLSELESIRGPSGLRVERDISFMADKTLTAYADEACRHQSIIA